MANEETIEGGSVVIRMKKVDHAAFLELIHQTSAEFMDSDEAKQFRALTKTYFPKAV